MMVHCLALISQTRRNRSSTIFLSGILVNIVNFSERISLSRDGELCRAFVALLVNHVEELQQQIELRQPRCRPSPAQSWPSSGATGLADRAVVSSPLNVGMAHPHLWGKPRHNRHNDDRTSTPSPIPFPNPPKHQHLSKFWDWNHFHQESPRNHNPATQNIFVHIADNSTAVVWDNVGS